MQITKTHLQINIKKMTEATLSVEGSHQLRLNEGDPMCEDGEGIGHTLIVGGRSQTPSCKNVVHQGAQWGTILHGCWRSRGRSR